MKDIEYDLTQLRESLKHHDKNILIFEEAINKELELKAETRRLIRELEQKLN